MGPRALAVALLAFIGTYRVGCDCGGCTGVTAPPDDGGSDAGEGDAGPGDPSRFCFQGWCWENPRPTSMELSAVWAAGPGDVWVGGGGGLVLHFAQGALTPYGLPLTPLARVSGLTSCAGLLTAVADDGSIHAFVDGGWSSLATVPGGLLRSAWSPAAGAPCLLAGRRGQDPLVLVFDPLDGGVLELALPGADAGGAVVGLSGNTQRAWLGLANGQVFSLDLGTLAAAAVPSAQLDAGLTGFCALADGGLWAGSSTEQLGFGWVGGAWSPTALAHGNVGAACSADRALLYGDPLQVPEAPTLLYRCAAGACTPDTTVDAGNPFSSGHTNIFPASVLGAFLRGADTWVVGEGGAVFESLSGGPFQSLTSGPRETLWDVWLDSDGGAWATGQNGIILRRSTSGWARVPNPFGLNDIFFVVGFGADWLVGVAGGVFRMDAAGSFTRIDDVDLDGGGLPGGFVVGINGPPENLWYVDESGGSGIHTALRFDGMRFVAQLQQTTARLNAVFATDAGTAWVGGDRDFVSYFDGTAWSQVSLDGGNGMETVTGIAGQSATDVFFASTTNLFHRRSDGSWAPPLSMAPYFHPLGHVGAVTDPSNGDLWLIGTWYDGQHTGVLHLEDAGVTFEILQARGVGTTPHLFGRELWFAMFGGAILTRTLP